MIICVVEMGDETLFKSLVKEDLITFSSELVSRGSSRNILWILDYQQVTPEIILSEGTNHKSALVTASYKGHLNFVKKAVQKIYYSHINNSRSELIEFQFRRAIKNALTCEIAIYLKDSLDILLSPRIGPLTMNNSISQPAPVLNDGLIEVLYNKESSCICGYSPTEGGAKHFMFEVCERIDLNFNLRQYSKNGLNFIADEDRVTICSMSIPPVEHIKLTSRCYDITRKNYDSLCNDKEFIIDRAVPGFYVEGDLSNKISIHPSKVIVKKKRDLCYYRFGWAIVIRREHRI